MVHPLCKTVWQFLKKLNIELSYDPPILLLGIYPKKLKTGPLKKCIYTPMFKAALSTCPKIWK